MIPLWVGVFCFVVGVAFGYVVRSALDAWSESLTDDQLNAMSNDMLTKIRRRRNKRR